MQGLIGEMASTLKEDENNEKIIRGLLKQSGNRKCINCNVLGPQYVCTTFSTFICANCSGIHREFTHRVKSVSMAKFTQQEMSSLQDGGNERAKKVFFKDLDPRRLKSPDTSNLDKLRNFIKHVYVDRRYTGERSIDKPPRAKMGDKEEPNEDKKSNPYQSSSRTPPYLDERRHSDRPSPGPDVRRSSKYNQDNPKHNHFEKSPARSVVSDWRRADRFSNGKKSDDCQSYEGESKPGIRSSDSQNDSNISSPPTVLPVSDLLGENVKTLQITEPPRVNTSSSAITQETASSSSLESSDGHSTELIPETSLIDFDAPAEPAVTAAVTPVPQSIAGQSVALSTSTPSDDIWGCLVTVPEYTASQAPPVTNQLGMTAHPQAPQEPHAVTQAPQPIPAQTLEANAKSSKELPMDLFTATYSAMPYQGPAWQTGQLPGMGFPMQYNTAMATPTFSQPIISANPFDANAQSATSQSAMFPSVASGHAALPHMAVHGGSMHASGLGGARPSWMPPNASSYASAAPPHGSSFRPAIPGAYMGQQLHSNMQPSRPQGFGSYGSEGIHFGSNPAVATLNPSLGGNPFG